MFFKLFRSEKIEEISGTEKGKKILDSTWKKASMVGQLHARYRSPRNGRKTFECPEIVSFFFAINCGLSLSVRQLR